MRFHSGVIIVPQRGSESAGTLRCINAPVIGLLIAAFYSPVWATAILAKGDFALAAVAFLLLMTWRTPPGWWC